MLQRKTFPMIFLAAGIEGIGDYNLKLYAKEKKGHNLAIAVVSYGALMYTLIKILEDDQLSNMNVMWNACSQVINTSIGVGLLNEKLTDTEWLGQGLSLSGLGLVGSQEARPN